MKKGKPEYPFIPEEAVLKLYEPERFYSHGDNPAMKRYMSLAVENCARGEVLDMRTYFIDQGKRFMYARNWQDVLQRDFKAITFPRAFALFTLTSMGFWTATSWLTRLLPLGRRGIRTISQTSFYQTFGGVAVVGAFGLWAATAYLEWKTFRFTLHKFYRHVLLGDRNWLYEQDKEPSYGEYYFKDAPLSCDESFPYEARHEMSVKLRPPVTWEGRLKPLQ